MNRFHNGLLSTTLVILFSLGVYCQSLARDVFDSYDHNENLYYLPPAGWLNVLALGYNEALTDTLWVKCILYYSTSPKIKVPSKARLTDAQVKKLLREHPESTHTPKFINAIHTLDPQFRGAYVHGARLAMHHRGLLTKDTITLAADILKLGIERFPDDGQLLFHLGFLMYYELPPFLEKKERESAKQAGIDYFIRASRTSNPPPYVSMLSTNLLERHNLDEMAVTYIREQLSEESDPNIRKTLEKSLEKALIRQMKSDTSQLDHLYLQWKAGNPFIPFSLFTLLVDSESDMATDNTTHRWDR